MKKCKLGRVYDKAAWRNDEGWAGKRAASEERKKGKQEFAQAEEDSREQKQGARAKCNRINVGMHGRYY